MAEQVKENRQIINGLDALAQFIGTGRSFVFDLQRDGQLPPAVVLPGRRTPLFLVADVMAWLEEHRTQLPAHHRAKRRGRPTKRQQLAKREAVGE